QGSSARHARNASPHMAVQSLAMPTYSGRRKAITTVLWLLLPILLPRFPLPVVTLIVTAIVVPLMGYVAMPFLLRRFGGRVRR
ncbi:MAG: hypothetical protein ABL997_20970, partial [Planctomycetota bacterium]